MLKKSTSKRLIASITLFFLALTSIDTRSLHAQLASISEIQSAAADFRLEIPHELGKVENIHTGTGPVLFHIQEVHGNAQGQKQIQTILTYLQKHFGVNLIFLEGDASRLDTDNLEFIQADQQTNFEFLNRLSDLGLISGPELFLYQNRKAEGIGIENNSSYWTNGNFYFQILSEQKRIQRFLSILEAKVEREANQKLDKETRDFLKQEESFENETLSFEAWLAYLSQQARQRLKLELADPRNQFDWPNLVRLFAVKKLEEEIQTEKIEAEKQTFRAAITRFIPKNNALTRNLKQVFDGSSHNAEAAIEALVARLPRNFKYSLYPNLNRFIGIQLLSKEIKPDGLMDEIEALTDRILGARPEFSTTDPILNARSKFIFFRLLKKLLQLELTPKEYQKIKKSLPSPFKKNRLFRSALRFYETTQNRDHAMFQNIQSYLAKSGKTKAAVITGGFHAEPFRKYFTGQNYSYALISPQMENPKQGKDVYTRLSLSDLSAPGKSTRRLPDISVGRNALVRLGVNPAERYLAIEKHLKTWNSRRPELAAKLHASSTVRPSVLSGERTVNGIQLAPGDYGARASGEAIKPRPRVENHGRLLEVKRDTRGVRIVSISTNPSPQFHQIVSANLGFELISAASARSELRNKFNLQKTVDYIVELFRAETSRTELPNQQSLADSLGLSQPTFSKRWKEILEALKSLKVSEKIPESLLERIQTAVQAEKPRKKSPFPRKGYSRFNLQTTVDYIVQLFRRDEKRRKLPALRQLSKTLGFSHQVFHTYWDKILTALETLEPTPEIPKALADRIRIAVAVSRDPMQATHNYIVQLFLQDEKRQKLPTQMQLSQALGLTQGAFSHHWNEILTALETLKVSDEIPQPVIDRIHAAVRAKRSSRRSELHSTSFKLRTAQDAGPFARRSELRTETFNYNYERLQKTMSFLMAYSFPARIRGTIEETLQRQDIIYSEQVVNSFITRGVKRVLVVGRRLFYLPLLLRSAGIEVIMIEKNPEHIEQLRGIWRSIDTELRLKNIEVPIDIEVIEAEFGKDSDSLKPFTGNPFDAITMIDLWAGESEEIYTRWFQQARGLLRRNRPAYLVLNDPKLTTYYDKSEDRYWKTFRSIFPGYEMAADYYGGTYDLLTYLQPVGGAPLVFQPNTNRLVEIPFEAATGRQSKEDLLQRLIQNWAQIRRSGAFIFDISGTLRWEGPISEEIASALAWLLEQGIHLVFTSGVSLETLREDVLNPIFRELPNPAKHYGNMTIYSGAGALKMTLNQDAQFVVDQAYTTRFEIPNELGQKISSSVQRFFRLWPVRLLLWIHRSAIIRFAAKRHPGKYILNDWRTSTHDASQYWIAHKAGQRVPVPVLQETRNPATGNLVHLILIFLPQIQLLPKWIWPWGARLDLRNLMIRYVKHSLGGDALFIDFQEANISTIHMVRRGVAKMADDDYPKFSGRGWDETFYFADDFGLEGLRVGVDEMVAGSKTIGRNTVSVGLSSRLGNSRVAYDIGSSKRPNGPRDLANFLGELRQHVRSELRLNPFDSGTARDDRPFDGRSELRTEEETLEKLLAHEKDLQARVRLAAKFAKHKNWKNIPVDERVIWRLSKKTGVPAILITRNRDVDMLKFDLRETYDGSGDSRLHDRLRLVRTFLNISPEALSEIPSIKKRGITAKQILEMEKEASSDKPREIPVDYIEAIAALAGLESPFIEHSLLWHWTVQNPDLTQKIRVIREALFGPGLSDFYREAKARRVVIPVGETQIRAYENKTSRDHTLPSYEYIIALSALILTPAEVIDKRILKDKLLGLPTLAERLRFARETLNHSPQSIGQHLKLPYSPTLIEAYEQSQGSSKIQAPMEYAKRLAKKLHIPAAYVDRRFLIEELQAAGEDTHEARYERLKRTITFIGLNYEQLEAITGVDSHDLHGYLHKDPKKRVLLTIYSEANYLKFVYKLAHLAGIDPGYILWGHSLEEHLSDIVLREEKTQKDMTHEKIKAARWASGESQTSLAKRLTQDEIEISHGMISLLEHPNPRIRVTPTQAYLSQLAQYAKLAAISLDRRILQEALLKTKDPYEAVRKINEFTGRKLKSIVEKLEAQSKSTAGMTPMMIEEFTTPGAPALKLEREQFVFLARLALIDPAYLDRSILEERLDAIPESEFHLRLRQVREFLLLDRPTLAQKLGTVTVAQIDTYERDNPKERRRPKPSYTQALAGLAGIHEALLPGLHIPKANSARYESSVKQNYLTQFSYKLAVLAEAVANIQPEERRRIMSEIKDFLSSYPGNSHIFSYLLYRLDFENGRKFFEGLAQEEDVVFESGSDKKQLTPAGKITLDFLTRVKSPQASILSPSRSELREKAEAGAPIWSRLSNLIYEMAQGGADASVIIRKLRESLANASSPTVDRYWNGPNADPAKGIKASQFYGFNVSENEYVVLAYHDDQTMEKRVRLRLRPHGKEVKLPNELWVPDVKERVQEILNTLDKLLGGDAIDFAWIFGSYANGDWTRDFDDVDLFIRLKHKKDVTRDTQNAALRLARSSPVVSQKAGYIQHMDPYIYFSPADDETFLTHPETRFEASVSPLVQADKVLFMFKISPSNRSELRMNGFYQQMGIRTYQKLLRSPSLKEWVAVNEPLAKADVAQYKNFIRFSLIMEAIHAPLFSLMSLMSLSFIGSGVIASTPSTGDRLLAISLGVALAAINLVNLYSVMLQRYNRRRVYRILAHKASRSELRASSAKRLTTEIYEWIKQLTRNIPEFPDPDVIGPGVVSGLSPAQIDTLDMLSEGTLTLSDFSSHGLGMLDIEFLRILISNPRAEKKIYKAVQWILSVVGEDNFKKIWKEESRRGELVKAVDWVIGSTTRFKSPAYFWPANRWLRSGTLSKEFLRELFILSPQSFGRFLWRIHDHPDPRLWEKEFIDNVLFLNPEVNWAFETKPANSAALLELFRRLQGQQRSELRELAPANLGMGSKVKAAAIYRFMIFARDFVAQINDPKLLRSIVQKEGILHGIIPPDIYAGISFSARVQDFLTQSPEISRRLSQAKSSQAPIRLFGTGEFDETDMALKSLFLASDPQSEYFHFVATPRAEKAAAHFKEKLRSLKPQLGFDPAVLPNFHILIAESDEDLALLTAKLFSREQAPTALIAAEALIKQISVHPNLARVLLRNAANQTAVFTLMTERLRNESVDQLKRYDEKDILEGSRAAALMLEIELFRQKIIRSAA